MNYTENVVVKQNRKSSNIAKAAVACACAGALAVGGVMAYLTATDTKTNNINVSDRLTVAVEETGWSSTETMLPTQIVDKDPALDFSGNLDDNYLFMKVVVPRANVATAALDGTPEAATPQDLFNLINASNEKITFTEGTPVNGWTPLSVTSTDTESTYVLQYTGDLNSGKTTKAFDKVQLINLLDNTDNQNAAVTAKAQNITVSGHAIQKMTAKADGSGNETMSAADAWAAYNKQNA